MIILNLKRLNPIKERRMNNGLNVLDMVMINIERMEIGVIRIRINWTQV